MHGQPGKSEHESLWQRILHFLKKDKVAFEFKSHKPTKIPYRPLSDDEFLEISGDLQKICDECDTELKDAISYSVRMMTKKTTRKQENEGKSSVEPTVMVQTKSDENHAAQKPYKH